MDGGGKLCIFYESRDLYSLAQTKYKMFLESFETQKLKSISRGWVPQSPECINPPISCSLKLFIAKTVISDTNIGNFQAEEGAIDCCMNITKSNSSPARFRAWAFFLLGSVELKRARQSGALQSLWNGYSNIHADDPLEKLHVSASIKHARKFFRSSISLLGSASDLLARDAMRCLALVTGPERTEFESESDMSCFTLLNASIGSSARQRIAASFQSVDSTETISGQARNGSSVEKIFRAFDCGLNSPIRSQLMKEFFQKMRDHLPDDWRFVAIALCPTGEILMSTIESSNPGNSLVTRSVCIFPECEENSEYLVNAYDGILKPLDSIIQRNQDQLKRVAVSAKDGERKKETFQREWWRDRDSLDEDLRALVEGVELKYFGSECAQLALNGMVSAMSCRNLASRFEAASVTEEAKPDTKTMKVAELRMEIERNGKKVKGLKKMRKAELIRLVVEERRRVAAAVSSSETSSDHHCTTSFSGTKATILILDENLHRFPFESLPSLEGKCVCRIPSLPFAVATIVESYSRQATLPVVDPQRTRYIIDPECNLTATRDRLMPSIQKLNLRYGDTWKGVVGSVPTQDFFRDSLTEKDGLVLYFGHGGGESCFSRSQIEGLSNSISDSHENSKNPCWGKIQSSIILMGCSSGRLLSVNRQDTLSKDSLPLHYEPEGIALSYLAAGAPCVLANLWDVTDRDIDHFSLRLLELFFDTQKHLPLAQCAANARSSCKMRHIIGCAPVCYGLPIVLKADG